MADREEVIALLTQDGYYRRIKDYPLIRLNEYLDQKETLFCSFQDMLYLERGSRGISSMNNTYEFHNNIAYRYPYSRELLIKFQDHLVAAGGAVMGACLNNGFHSDIDFFFYNLTIEEANVMRLEVINRLIELWQQDNEKTAKFFIQRNEFVTTVRVETNWSENYVYQFIHRIYPNIGLILGGFDLSISMLAYDGDNIYGVPLGFWSLQHRTIIVDTARRSTSFEHRLFKYHNKYFVNILFPGITEDIITEYVSIPAKDCSFSVLYEKIKMLAEENGFEYRINYGKYDMENMFKRSEQLSNSYLIQKQENILPHIKVGLNNEHYKIRNYPYDRNQVEDRLIDRSSDYGSSDIWAVNLPHINGKYLRFDRLSSVCSTIVFDMKDKDILTRLIEEVGNPRVDFDLDHYFKIAEKARNVHKNEKYDFYHLLKCFGRLTPEVIKVRDTEQYDNYVKIMVEKMTNNANICQQNLIGIKWITENPGRQWTSSINPIIEDPRLWYGKHYIPVLTGIPQEIESCLRLLRLRHPWHYLDNETFNIIMLYLLQYYAEDANRYIF